MRLRHDICDYAADFLSSVRFRCTVIAVNPSVPSQKEKLKETENISLGSRTSLLPEMTHTWKKTIKETGRGMCNLICKDQREGFINTAHV